MARTPISPLPRRSTARWLAAGLATDALISCQGSTNVVSPGWRLSAKRSASAGEVSRRLIAYASGSTSVARASASARVSQTRPVLEKLPTCGGMLHTALQTRG